MSDLDLDAIETEVQRLTKLKTERLEALKILGNDPSRDIVYSLAGCNWLNSSIETHCFSLIAECRRLRESWTYPIIPQKTKYDHSFLQPKVLRLGSAHDR